MLEYRELQGQDDFDQLAEFQRSVFGFSDLELLPPPLLRLVARDYPPLGLHLGAFSLEGGKSKLLGAALGFATFEPRSVYLALLGVFPEYQGKGQGQALVREFQKRALAKDIAILYGVFDPLDARLAQFYLNTLGFLGTRILGDRMLFRQELSSSYPVRQEGDRLVRLGEGALAELTDLLNHQGYQVVGFVQGTEEGHRISHYAMRPTL